MTSQQILTQLRQLADPEKAAYKEKKFGIKTSNTLGVYLKDLNALARTIGKDEKLALQLFDSDIHEAKILCSKIFPPKKLTEELMEKWVVTFDNWEICDAFSMGLFAKSPLAVLKIVEWSEREREFEKRAAFATMAAYCMADKKAENGVFESFFPLIVKAAKDDRNFVKKAVNWALRSIGKRNVDLNKKALEVSHDILQMENKAAQWIARDAIRELSSEKVNILDYPRTIYRKK